MGYSRDFLQSRFDAIVDFSELHAFLDVPVQNFFSGMSARLAFSIAVQVEPEILSALDALPSRSDNTDSGRAVFARSFPA